jgi:hypothetical protein
MPQSIYAYIWLYKYEYIGKFGQEGRDKLGPYKGGSPGNLAIDWD